MSLSVQNVSFTGAQSKLAKEISAKTGEYISDAVMEIVGRNASNAKNGGYIGESAFFGKLQTQYIPQNKTLSETAENATKTTGLHFDYIEGVKNSKAPIPVSNDFVLIDQPANSIQYFG